MNRCEICNKKFESKKAMTNHRRWHKIPKYKNFQDRMKVKYWFSGSEHPIWKGDDASYGAIHKWIRGKKFKPKFCEECKKNKPYDLSSKDGSCKRDINHYKWLCRHCHMKWDYKIGLRSVVRPDVSKRKRDNFGRFVLVKEGGLKICS